MSTGMVIVLTGIAFFILTCLAILDIARKDFGSIQMKALWGFLVAMVPFIGVVVYFLIGARRGKRPDESAPADGQTGT
jgi:heme/copper-type cytochrome/quinol oxidase subunit 2